LFDCFIKRSAPIHFVHPHIDNKNQINIKKVIIKSEAWISKKLRIKSIIEVYSRIAETNMLLIVAFCFVVIKKFNK
jgi:hypothetical protein